jgi:hypothetical protein
MVQMSRNMQKILLILGLIVAVLVIVFIGTHPPNTLSTKSNCTQCQPFVGTAVQDGKNLVLTVRQVPCEPAMCSPCGANPSEPIAVNISVFPECGGQFIIENQVMEIDEPVIIPGVLDPNFHDQVLVSASYSGWKNITCNQSIVDTWL